MSELLKKLSELADQLDGLNSIKLADELDALIKEVARREKEEAEDIEANLTFCPECEGSGAGIDSPWCALCKGTGFVALKEASLIKVSYIKHEGNEWVVYSRKGKSLGKYKTKKKALQRLRQIEFWKRQ